MDRYAVIGSPIKHSLSPRIHALFAEQLGQALEYSAIEVHPERFFHSVNELAAQGYKGLNVTVPLKQLAWEMADHADATADRAKAVNTLRFESGDLRYGYNTDGQGLLRDLSVNHGFEIAGCDILVLGAGGAVRGVLMPLLKHKPRQLVIANRTAGKAIQLATEFSDLGPVQGCGLDDISNTGETSFDLMINGTSASLGGELPALPDDILKAGGVTYDMVYSAQPTPFVQWGLQHDASKALDGLGMLVEQAAESFFIWRDARPETVPVLETLGHELGR